MTGNLRLKNVEIVLENDQKVFQMGENVHGKLVVNILTGDLPLSTLQIGVVCMSKIKYSDDTFDQKKLLETFYQLPKSGKSAVLSPQWAFLYSFAVRLQIPSHGRPLGCNQSANRTVFVAVRASWQFINYS